MKIGEYTITIFDEQSYWIAHESGEGTQVSKREFEKLIRDFYNKIF